MTIIKEDGLNVLIPKEGYRFKAINDNYIPKSIDENGNITDEHIPYYFEKAYVPDNMTLEKLVEIYEEVEVEYGK